MSHLDTDPIQRSPSKLKPLTGAVVGTFVAGAVYSLEGAVMSIPLIISADSFRSPDQPLNMLPIVALVCLSMVLVAEAQANEGGILKWLFFSGANVGKWVNQKIVQS